MKPLDFIQKYWTILSAIVGFLVGVAVLKDAVQDNTAAIQSLETGLETRDTRQADINTDIYFQLGRLQGQSDDEE